MPDIDDVNDAILQSAVDGIKSATVGNETVEQMPIGDQIKAAAHVAGQAAASTAKFGLRYGKQIMPGCG